MKSVEHIKKRIVELDELIESHHQHIKDAEIAKQTYMDSINIIHDEENNHNKTEKPYRTSNVPLIENPKRKYKARKGVKGIGFREGSQSYKAQKVLLKSGKPLGIPELAKACDVSKENYRAFGSGLADKSRVGNVFIKMDRGVYGLIELLGTYG